MHVAQGDALVECYDKGKRRRVAVEYAFADECAPKDAPPEGLPGHPDNRTWDGILADTLRVRGLGGTGTFNVTTASDGRSRHTFVDGGLPSGKKKSTDNVNMFYTPPRPTIIHSPATKDPVAGVVDLDYGTARFVVQYD
jgi:hypothetical protein